MKNLFVPFELAKQLKEKGFDEPCLAYYNLNKILNRVPFECTTNKVKNPSFDIDKNTDAPLYQQVVDWFREKHLIEISTSSYYYPKHYGIVARIGYSDTSNTKYTESEYGEGIGKRMKHEKVVVYSERYFESYYEALDKAIEEALKLIN